VVRKLCQELCRYPPTLAVATDAEVQQFRRWATPTDAAGGVPKAGALPDCATPRKLLCYSILEDITQRHDAENCDKDRSATSPFVSVSAHRDSIAVMYRCKATRPRERSGNRPENPRVLRVSDTDV
jgi:hypothetical protein